MKTLRATLPLAFVFALTAGAALQPEPQRDRDSYQNRDRHDQNRDRGRYDRNREREYLAPVYASRRDLEMVQRQRRLSERDRRRVESGLHNIDRFMANWNRGKFDKDRLDGLIEDLNGLSRSDRLPPGERRMFARDRDEMRGFRARGDYRRR